MSWRIFQEKYRPIVWLIIAFTLGFLSIGIVYYVASRDAIRTGIVQQALPLLADNINAEIQKDLLRPALLSSMMAQDAFVREWMLGGEQDVGRIAQYLNDIKTRYKVDNAFLVSERTRAYYGPSGRLKTVSPNDPLDQWYFQMRETAVPVKVNPVKNHRHRLTVFVNDRVLDARGNFIGSTGIGLTLGAIGDRIDSRQDTFNCRVYLVDKQGAIILSGKSMADVRGSIRAMPGIAAVADSILKGDSTPRQLEYRTASSTVLLNSRYIPELGSFLLIEQDERPSIKGVWQVLLFGLAIAAVLGWLALTILRRLVDRYQQHIESITGDALAHAARETEIARQQQEFVTMISHEFRTPLAIIDSSLQSLKRYQDNMPAEVSSRYMRIRRASLRLQELIGDYLTGDRLMQANFEPGTEHIDIFQLLTRTTERVEWPNMTVNTGGQTAIVVGDTELLRIVFFNILSNAIKYSPLLGLIHVDGTVKACFAEIRITDSGTGISPTDLPHIFDKHYRAAANKAPGTGLGLHLVQRIVTLHGGTVSADSMSGQGTTICIRLPVVSAE